MAIEWELRHTFDGHLYLILEAGPDPAVDDLFWISQSGEHAIDAQRPGQLRSVCPQQPPKVVVYPTGGAALLFPDRHEAYDVAFSGRIDPVIDVSAVWRQW